MKKLLSLLLAGLLALSVTIPALAAPAGEAEQAAWTLYHYGLFQGLSTDARDFPVFGLDQVPTRAQGVTMLVRLLGKEETALNGTWTTPFTDVPDWAAQAVSNLCACDICSGDDFRASGTLTRFDAAEMLSAAMDVLEARGKNARFSWSG